MASVGQSSKPPGRLWLFLCLPIFTKSFFSFLLHCAVFMAFLVVATACSNFLHARMSLNGQLPVAKGFCIVLSCASCLQSIYSPFDALLYGGGARQLPYSLTFPLPHFVHCGVRHYSPVLDFQTEKIGCKVPTYKTVVCSFSVHPAERQTLSPLDREILGIFTIHWPSLWAFHMWACSTRLL